MTEHDGQGCEAAKPVDMKISQIPTTDGGTLSRREAGNKLTCTAPKRSRVLVDDTTGWHSGSAQSAGSARPLRRYHHGLATADRLVASRSATASRAIPRPRVAT